MIAPSWEELFSAIDDLALPQRSYPFRGASPSGDNYQDLPLIKLFVYARIKGITAFKSLHKHLTIRPEVLALLGLESVPHRKTIAARFRALTASVVSLLHQLSERFILGISQGFVKMGVVDPSNLDARPRQCLA